MTASANSEKPVVPRYFYSLDVLRGVAALSVVFWHWSHFFFQGTTLQAFDAKRRPLYGLFRLFYNDGSRAVDLFFCLSGFIFFWLYAEKVHRRQTRLGEFALLRFSRLYPLHLLTLLFVLVAQQYMLRRHGSYFVYAFNDLYHFCLQLFLASSWGFERSLSFNGPIWSVSVEVLCYAAFFVLCLLLRPRWWQLVLLIGAGYLLQTEGFFAVGHGVTSFFVGGLFFQIFRRVADHGFSGTALGVLGAVVALLWVIIPLNEHYPLFAPVYKRYLWSERLLWHGRDVIGEGIDKLSVESFSLLLFPLTIIAMALWETQRGTLGKRLAFIGHLSYSSYLLHFPLQIVFAAVALSWSIPRTFFYSPWSLGLFFLVLIPLSLGSYHFVERPCQSLVRRWVPRRASASVAAGAAGRALP